ncbi:MAG: glycosyl transferase family protein [Halioglobus sp.]
MKKPTANRPEHAFAAFVRILGKGKTGTRSLTLAEAEEAFGMILSGQAEPVQVGAFLMLLRVKEETGEELAGFVRACRRIMPPPPENLGVDLDWSSYAGKKHQHPWFILSLLLLSQAGYRTLIHGAEGHTPERLYTEAAMDALQLPVADSWGKVAEGLQTTGLCYMPLADLCPSLHELIQLRPLLGLRSPVHTLTRMLNPTVANASIQSIFHPAYGVLHQEADRILEQPAALVFKGDSGEVEIKPHADTRLMYLRNGKTEEQLLMRSIDSRVGSVASPSVEPLRQLWRDESNDDYGLRAVLATTAVALSLIEKTLDMDAAMDAARTLWQNRDSQRISACP